MATYAPQKLGMARYAPKHAYLHRHYGTTTTTGPSITYLPKKQQNLRGSTTTALYA